MGRRRKKNPEMTLIEACEGTIRELDDKLNDLCAEVERLIACRKYLADLLRRKREAGARLEGK